MRGQRAGLVAPFEGWAISGSVRLNLPQRPRQAWRRTLRNGLLRRKVLGKFRKSGNHVVGRRISAA